MPDSKYDLVANTYTAKEQSFAVCEVGDAKQPDAFYPQVKIMRWDNEVNFSVRLVHEEDTPAVALADDKVQWAGEKIEANFYELEDGKEGGGFEFDIHLKEKPKTPRITFTIQTKGLNFYPQPELTKEEIDRGCIRPENVIDSIAVYHKTRSGDYTAFGALLKEGELFLPSWYGKDYKAGKAFHIMRPKMVDAAGWEVWGEPSIDEVNGYFYVDMPEEFWAKAVYPVRHAAGLTFGYTSDAQTADPYGGDYQGIVKATSIPSAGTLQSVKLLCKTNSGTNTFCPALYSDPPTTANSRLAYLNSGGTAMTASKEWKETNLSYALSNVEYYLGHADPLGSGNYTTYYDAGTGPQIYYAARTTWPTDVSTWTAAGNVFISIHGVYDAAGGLSIPVAMHHYKQQRRY